MSDKRFKLGFLTHVFGSDPAQGYRDLLEQFELAEELGFDGGWIAQHHLDGGFGLLPSPLVPLAAIATRTRRIELGTGVVVLPLEHAVRLAEDAAVLDTLSNGRVQLGLGSGGANLEVFEAFERETEWRQDDFRRQQQALQRILAGESLVAERQVTLQPPAADLRQRLWHSASTTEGAAYAASQQNGLLIGTATHNPETVQKPLAEAYLSAWTASARPPRIGVVRAVFPAADREQARAELAADINRHIDRLLREGVIDQPQTLEDHLFHLNVHYGHPRDIVRGLKEDPAFLGYADYFLPVVQSETSSQEQVLRRLEILATEIAPALGWQAGRH